MFLDPSEFLFTALLEARWKTIRREFEQLASRQLMPWPETELYNQGWDVFGLWGFGQRFDDPCRLCPETAATVEAIPGLTTAGFSLANSVVRLSFRMAFRHFCATGGCWRTRGAGYEPAASAASTLN